MADFGLAAWLHDITGFRSERDVEAYADRLAEIGYDIFIPCVKNMHGALGFLTGGGDVNADYPTWDPLKVLIGACRARGIRVHAWFCVFTEGERSRLLREHPEFAARFDGGGGHRWSCACRPEVQDYVFELYRDLTSRYRPDGLHLDYIRTGAVCTCDYCKDEMARRGVDITAVLFKDPAYEGWIEWRVSRVTGFVERMREFTRSEGLELSAAVYAGEYPDSYCSQAQDWVEWAEKRMVDYLFMMNYTNSTRRAVMRTISHAAWIGDTVAFWEGLGKHSSTSRLSTEMLTQQIRAVLDAGARGIVLFHDGAVTDEDIEAIHSLRSS